MLHIALWEPEIPPNTGTIARLCAAAGATLHLIGRLGFRLDDKSLRRAGVDYWPLVEWRRHATLTEFEANLSNTRVFCFSAHGQGLANHSVISAKVGKVTSSANCGTGERDVEEVGNCGQCALVPTHERCN